MQESDVVAIEVCKDNQQIQDGDSRRRDGEIEHVRIEKDPHELFILDSSLNLTKLRVNFDGCTSEKLSVRKLAHVKGLAEAVRNLAPGEGVSISDRALVIREKCFVIESGYSYCALSQECTQVKEFEVKSAGYRSQSVAHSLAIAYSNVHNGLQAIQTDPGRRGTLFGTSDLWRYLRSLH